MPLQQDLLEWLRNSGVGDLHAHSGFSICCKEITIQDLAARSTISRIPITLTDHSSHLLLGTDRDLIYNENITPQALTDLLKGHQQTGIRRYDEYIRYFKKESSSFLRLGVELDALDNGLLFFPAHLLPEINLFIGHVPHLLAYRRNESVTNIMAEWRRRTEALMAAGVDVVAHPLRVLCSKQIPFILDETASWLVEKAGNYSTALEINAHKQYPEADEVMVKKAIAQGIKLAIGTDSHHMRELNGFSYHSIVLDRCRVNADRLDNILYNGQSKRQINSDACWCF
jgi:DNA polymerase (family 10)